MMEYVFPECLLSRLASIPYLWKPLPRKVKMLDYLEEIIKDAFWRTLSILSG